MSATTTIATATATAAPRRIAAAALLALLGLATLLGAACDGDNGDDELREITFMAGFRPQATLPFTAVYVAAAQGLLRGRGPRRHDPALDAGRAPATAARR